METTQNTFGLLLRREQPSYGGSPYLIAEIVRREGEHHAPRNVPGSSYCYDNADDTTLPGHRLANLELRGHVYDGGDFPFVGWQPHFASVFSVEAKDARAMVKTLDRIGARLKKDAAQEPADVLASVCAALKLSFVVERVGEGPGRSSYDDNQWHWMSIGEGRNRYRRLIAELRDAERERKAA